MSQQYGKVDSALVDHHHFRMLSERAKLICLHLRVTARNNAIGCFYYPASHIADDLDIPFEGATEALLELSERAFSRYCETTRWVWIPKYLEHFPVKGRNSGKHALAVLQTVPREFEFTEALVVVFEGNHSWEGDKESGDLDQEWNEIKRGFEGASKGVSSRASSLSLSTTTLNTTTVSTSDQQRSLSDKPDGSPKELPMDSVELVFDHWCEVCNHPQSKLTSDRIALIRRRGKSHSVEQMQKAITGCSVTPHNQGENNNGTKYDDLELILRNAAHIERFERNADNPPRKARKSNGAGEQFVIDGEEIHLPPNLNGENDPELNRLCARFSVTIRGLNRQAAREKLRKVLEAEQTSTRA